MGKFEEKFFAAFIGVTGEKYLKTKHIDKKITKADVKLFKSYRKNKYPVTVEDTIDDILQDLHWTADISSGSMSHFVDGIILNHPNLGSRILEFDEVQHFSPYRLITLQHLETILDENFIPNYKVYCANRKKFIRVLQKHRIKLNISMVPKTFEQFKTLIEGNYNPNNGYIKKVKGFNYISGRIAQRAFYDTLRDVAHLSSLNEKLQPIIRFSIFEFEEKLGKFFKDISTEEMSFIIEHKLKNYFV